jgi:signal transduction histidine kinase
MDGKHDLRGASIAMKESLDALQKAGNEYEIASQMQALAESLSRYGRHDEARKYLLQALEIARRTDNRQVEKYSLQNLADVEERTGHPAAALEYLRQFIIVNDSINLRANQKQVNALESKYGSEIKEYKINQLQKEKQIQAMSLSRKSTLNYILFGSMMLLIALGSLAWRNFRKSAQLSRQQKALDEQRIRELERSKQFVAVEALLKGQEEERVRVAKDLHDGMGGMLSGVKYSLLHLQQQTSPGQVNDFDGPIQALDRSITELRRVAHNMMPDALVRFGLDEALRDFCTSFHSVGVLSVRYQSFGMDRRIEPSREIVLYRIVQELLNNAIKHAEATEILVQLVQSGERLSITVEDNGVGFVPAKMEEGKGAGWKNIRSRVDYLKGRLDIDSEPGNGPSVFIEVNV